MIDPETLEAAAYKFAELYRDGGEMHERTGTAVMVESVVLTEEKQAAMGLAAGTLPVGWWVGFRVTDDDVWEKVKSGEYSMFSIGGTAIREDMLELKKSRTTELQQSDKQEHRETGVFCL